MHSKSWLMVATLFSVTAAGSDPAGTFQIRTHVASAQASRVSSHLIVSGGEIAVIDGQLLLEEADRVIALARREKGTVRTIFVTHAHPDHYLSLLRLTEAFPQARVVAMPPVAEAIGRDGPAALQAAQARFSAGALPTSLPPIAKHDAFLLRVGSSEWELLPFTQAESAQAYALWNRRTRTLIAGDLVYAHAHLWLADPDAQLEKWAGALEQLKAMGPRRVYPGHGGPGGPELLTRNLEYLRYFKRSAEESTSAAQLEQKVRSRFPRLELRGFLGASARRRFPVTGPEPELPDAGMKTMPVPLEPGTRKEPPPDLTR